MRHSGVFLAEIIGRTGAINSSSSSAGRELPPSGGADGDADAVIIDEVVAGFTPAVAALYRGSSKKKVEPNPWPRDSNPK